MGKYWITIEAETLEDAENAVSLLDDLELEEKTRTIVKGEGATQVVLGSVEENR